MDEQRIPTMPQADDDMEERIPTMPQEDGDTEERIPTMPQEDGDTEERIPTMPQEEGDVGEWIPTMPQEEGDVGERIPTMPQEEGDVGERIPTMPQDAAGTEERIPTMPQSVGMAVRTGTGKAAAGSGKYLLSADMMFTGESGRRFRIEGGHVISADSGESQIYACSRDGDEKKYVARILLSVTPGSSFARKRTRDKVIAFLTKIRDEQHTHILPLIEYGTILLQGKEYYVEIYPCCKSGDLGKRKGRFSYRELHDQVIPALNEALHRFHGAGLVHRDVKPDNLYLYQGEVVIADFGITCDLREDGFATDKEKNGTLGYYAPELMGQAAVCASDYYSFGQTVWTLYNGEMMYRNILRRYKEEGIAEQRAQVNNAMLTNTFYGLEEIDEKDAFLEVLIRGLLQYAPSARFDYAKVKRWLEGDKGLAREIPGYEQSKIFTRSIRIFGRECWEDEDIWKGMCSHWDDALFALYDGVLKNFYGMQNFEHSCFLDKIMKKYTRCSNEKAIPFQNNVGLAKTIMYLSGYKVLCWRGQIYNDLDEISLALEGFLERGEADNDYYGLLFSGLITEWYEKKSPPQQLQQEVVEALQLVTDTLKADNKGEGMCFYWMYFLLSADKSKRTICGCDSLEAFTRYLLEKPGRLYADEKDQPVVDSLRFLGLLCFWGYDRVAGRFRKGLKKEYAERYELLFDFMEQQMKTEEDRKLVDHAYCHYGPRGYLCWWKEHLDEYRYQGSNSRSLKASIEAVKLEENAGIPVQREAFAKLNTLALQFLEKIEADLILGSIGVQGFSEDFIFADKLSCTWQYLFMGQMAPVGYKYSLGI